MKISLKHLTIGLSFIAIIVFSIYAWGSRKNMDFPTVSVFLAYGSEDKLSQFQEGIHDCADDYGIMLNFIHSDSIDSFEKKLFAEIEHGSEGIILISPESFINLSDESEKKHFEYIIDKSSLPSLVFDTEFEFDGVISADYRFDIGEYAARSVLENGQISSVHIITDGEDKSSEKYAKEAEIFLTKANIEYNISENVEDLGILKSNDGIIDCTGKVNFNDNVRAGYVCAIGIDKKNKAEVAEGKIDALIVPNNFQMGYLCLQAVYNGIHSRQSNNVVGDCLIVTSENIYSNDIAPLLFE